MFSCIVIEKDDRYRLITYPIVKSMGVDISQIWTLLTCIVLSPFKWLFVDGVKVHCTPSYRVIFDYLCYWGCSIIGA